MNCNGSWSSEGIVLDIDMVDWVTFEIIVENFGSDVLDIVVKDILPEGFTYNDNATPFEPFISGQNLFWNFTDVDPDEIIVIQFRAIIDDWCPEYPEKIAVICDPGFLWCSYEFSECHWVVL